MAIIREEGSNGDREMAAAVYAVSAALCVNIATGRFQQAPLRAAPAPDNLLDCFTALNTGMELRDVHTNALPCRLSLYMSLLCPHPIPDCRRAWSCGTCT